MSSRSLLKGTILALYNSWGDALRAIHEVTAPAALEMWRQDLLRMWKEAERLNKIEGIHALDRHYLKLILQRSPEQWWLFAKSRGKPIPNTDRYTPTRK